MMTGMIRWAWVFLLLILTIGALAAETPIWVKTLGANTYSSPLVADVNNDRQNEIVIGQGNGLVMVFSGRNDADPLLTLTTGKQITATPACGLLGSSTAIVCGSWDGKMYAWNGSTGTTLWTVDTGKPIRSSAAIGDVNGDGSNEVVFGSDNGKLYAVGPNGVDLRGFPYQLNKDKASAIASSPALADIDNDGKLEIAVGADDGKVYLLKVTSDGPTIMTGYPVSTEYMVRSSPIFADIDGDGRYEIVVGSDDFSIYAFELDGKYPSVLVEELDKITNRKIKKRVSKWPVKTEYKIQFSSPAAADVDNDKRPEVFIGSGDGFLYALKGDGNPLPGFPAKMGGKLYYSSPVIGDVSGDGTPDIVIASSDGGVYAVDSKGAPISGFPIVTGAGNSINVTPAIADVNGDGILEVVFADSSRSVMAYSTNSRSVSSFYNPWNQFRQNQWHTGAFGVASGGVVEIPTCKVETPKVIVSNDVSINYQLADKSNSLIDLEAQFSIDWGREWKPATIIGKTTGIGPSAYKGSVIWDSRKDMMGPMEAAGETDPKKLAEERRQYRERASVVFKLIPSNSNGVGNGGETGNIWVHNNLSPSVTVKNPMEQPEYQPNTSGKAKKPAGDIKIYYSFADEEEDTVGFVHEAATEKETRVMPEFSTDAGKTWHEAKHISGLSAGIRPSKYEGYIVWESDKETEMIGLDSYDIMFRITPFETSNVNENVVFPGNPGSTAPFHVDNNDPPRILLTDLTEDSYSDDVTISYDLTDREDDIVNLKIYYSIDGGTTWSPKEATVEAKGLTISKTAYDTEHKVSGTFVWQSKKDLPGTDSRMIQIKAVPTDNDEGKADATGNFHLDNNDPPSATIAKIDGEQKDDVTVPFSLADTEGDTISILCEYSTQGDKEGSWKTATVTGNTSGFSSGQYSGSIVWNTSVDLMGVDQKDVLFRITPSDNDSGKPGASPPIWVDDNAPPSCLLADITEDQKGDVPLSFTLSDIEQDTLTLKVEYSVDAGTTWKPATVTGTTTMISPENYAGDLVWNSLKDIPHQDISTIQVKVTPSDNDAGNSGATANFRVDNNEPPAIALETPSGMQKGDVPISYTITDAESDAIDLICEYSEDAGQTWVLATIKNEVKGITAANYKGKIVWDSVRDAAGIDKDTMQFRVTPKDNKEGTMGATSNFRLNNNVPPTIAINPLPTGADGKLMTQKGEIEIPFVITDPENDPISLKCEYSEDGGRSWQPATVDGLTQDIDSAGYIGTVMWNSSSSGNLPNAYLADVMFRITPSDKDEGKPSDTGKFPIDNNVPPIVRLSTPEGKLNGDVKISYELDDPEKDVTELKCEFSTDDGLTWNDKPSMPAGITNIDPNRYAGVLTWYSANDLKGVDLTTVRFRVTPYDHRSGTSDTTGSFHVDNNTAPKVAINDMGKNWQGGELHINYRIEDAESNSVTLQSQYSVDGGASWKDATMLGNTMNLEPGQYSGSITWNSVTDLPGLRSDKVMFRMLPSDNDQGVAFTTPAFNLDNNRPPSIALNNIFDSVKGDITIEYLVSDDEDDSVSLSCEFSPDNGQSWKPATVTGNLANLSKAAYQGSLVWKSSGDISGVDSTQVLFRVTPSDWNKGTAGITAPMHVNNNQAPSITLSAPSGVGQGEMKIGYAINDAEKDEVSLNVEFSVDGGTTWEAAHISGDYQSIKSSNYAGSFTWLSDKDASGVASNKVLLRVIPRDDSGSGQPVVSGNLNVNNNQPPVIAFSLPKDRLSGEVPIDFTISDPENDNVNLNVEVSGDGGSTWKKATISSGSITDISNLNYSSSFIWNLAKDLPGSHSDSIAMRITPSEANGNIGKAVIVSGIQINNNEPPRITLNMGNVNAAGDVPVSYSISDSESDNNISLEAEYSPDGGFTWMKATTEGNTGNIGPAGYKGTLTWISSKDVPGKNLDSVQFRITPADFSKGEPAVSTNFNLKNNQPPSISLGTAQGSTGDIRIPYTIKDRENDKISLECDYSTDGGKTWLPASILGMVTEIDSKGYDGTLVWASSTDAMSKAGSMMLRVTPRDAEPGQATSVSVGVDNNTLPTVTLTDPIDVVKNEAKIDYSIFDLENDPVTLQIEYSSDGSIWKTATIKESLRELRSFNGTLTWDTISDIGNGKSARVQLRATPVQGGKSGKPAMTSQFDVSNVQAPTVQSISASNPDANGDVSISYTLASSDNGTLDIRTEYSDDGGLSWYPATVSGNKTGISSSAYSGKLTWRFKQDVATEIPGADFVFRIIPYNKEVEGKPGQTKVEAPSTGQ